MTSPSSSTTTGLLTLSVHDSLTFDGVEVALNPDLFSTNISKNDSTSSTNNGEVVIVSNQRRPSSGSVASTATSAFLGGSGGGGGTHSRQPSRDSITSSSFVGRGEGVRVPVNVPVPVPVHYQNHHHSREASSNSVTYANFGIHTNNQSTVNAPPPIRRHGLQPGDMIEIRVWEEKKSRNENGRSSNKGLYHVSSSKNTAMQHQQQQHVKTVIDRAASKLQQHVNQSSSTSSIVHPLAPPPPTITTGTLITATTTGFSDQSSTAKKYSASNGPTAISSKPPMAPRASSNASSLGASPMHTAPTPSLSPSPSHHQSSNTPKLHLLPRWHNDSKDSSILHDDVTVSSNGNNTDAGSTSNTVVENVKMNLPFPEVATIEKTVSGTNSIMQSPKQSSVSGTATSVSGTATPNLVSIQSYDNVEFDSSMNPEHVDVDDDDQQEVVTPLSPSGMHPQPQNEQQGQHEAMIELISKSHVLKTKFVMGVTEKSLKALKSSGRTQISLLKKVATLYDLSPFDIVSITKIGTSEEASVLESARADYVTLTIKDQFISRGEMHRFQEYFQGKWIYSGERLKTKDDMCGYVMDIRNKGQELKSGFLTEETKITFRSHSARIFWLVQISSEMWDYASPYVEQGNGDGTCEMYFDKFITFMKRLFDEWKALEVTHSLTIVFFSRTYIKSKFSAETRSMITTNPKQSSIARDIDGRLYEDFYKTIVENTTKTTNWETIITDVKKAFVSYPSEVGWKVSRDNSYSRVPSTAAQGNILESINLALNVMQLHYIDRDLYRTGNSVVVVSAGSGVFQVDKNLAAITKQRMMDNGIGSDMLSLGLPPLHVAPFFLYKDPSDDFDESKVYYEIPHWMHLSFAAYDRPNKSKTKSTSTGKCGQAQPSMQIMSNGFVVHHTSTNKKEDKRQQPQHLISDRDFEDILEACRPRNLEAAKVGLPKALVAQMNIFGLMGKVDSSKNYAHSKWGTLDFDAASNDSRKDDDARSKSSHSTNSHFANTYLLLLNHSPKSPTVSSHSPGSPLQIQQSRSLELPSYLQNLTKLRNATREYDRNVFIPVAEKNDAIHPTSSNNVEQDDAIASSPSSSSSSPSPVKPQNPSGGIGAAIDQYENKSDRIQVDNSKNPNTPQKQSFMPREPTTITRVKRAFVNPKLVSSSHSPYMRAASLNYLHERIEEKAVNRMDVTQHTVTFLPHTKPLEIPSSMSRSIHSDENTNGRSFNKNGVSHLSNSPKTSLTNNSGSPSGRLSLAKPNFGSQGNQAFLDQKKRSQGETSPGPSHQYTRRKQWVFNPFRQKDEDEVLATKDHNSRRWSHVFPQGEIEFKRQSGPNWRSLCQPAILPIQIDVLPSQEELNSSKYKTAYYDLQLDAMDNTFFKTHADLLKEMLRQRLTQDYQQVPRAVIVESSRISRDNAEKLHKTYSLRNLSSSGSKRGNRENGSYRTKGDSQIPTIALSMGHRIQTMTLIPNAVNIKIFTRRDASNSIEDNTSKYNFKLWLPASQRYMTVNQTFDKYQEEYMWNPLDLLISGDTNMYLAENSRNRCISFRVIPAIFENVEQEKSYISKILVLVEYLERLAQKKLGIELVSSSNGVGKRNIRFKVDLRKGKRDKYEWMEVVVDSTISTKRAFGITFHWLVATSMKIDSHVKALQRKCPKLNLVFAAFSSSQSNFYMHPFVRPESFKVPNSAIAKIVEEALLRRFDFCDDGIIEVYPEHTFGVKCKKINSRKKWEKWATKTRYKAQQYINRTAILFIRLLVDEDDSVLFLCLENRRHIGNDSDLLIASRRLLQQIKDFVNSIHN